MEASKHNPIASVLLRLPMERLAMITNAAARMYHACIV
jgi:hypothetical protein